MADLNQHIAAIKKDLTQVLITLSGVNDYNFDEKIDLVNKKLSLVKSRKEQMYNNFDKTELEKNNPELGSIIKEISDKFFNLINEKTMEKDKIGQELKVKQNEKKLVNYKR